MQLLDAAAAGDMQALQDALDAGADVLEVDKQGMSALMKVS